VLSHLGAGGYHPPVQNPSRQVRNTRGFGALHHLRSRQAIVIKQERAVVRENRLKLGLHAGLAGCMTDCRWLGF